MAQGNIGFKMGFRLAPAPVPALQVLNLVNTTARLTTVATSSNLHRHHTHGLQHRPPGRPVLTLVLTFDNARPARLCLSIPQQWGGSVVSDGVGGHHLYASAFSGRCGLAAWETNSYVVHAVSTTGPGGPFAVVDTAVPSFVRALAHCEV